MPQRDHSLTQLGDFLRARRAEVAPEVENSGRRQVSGLRRAEVAERAYISPDYYARIEQARLAPSRATLDAIAQALGMDADQRRYAQRLLARAKPEDAASEVQRDPAVVQLLHRMTGVATIVIGPGTAILGWNPVAAALLIDFSDVPEAQRNYAWLLFEHPVFQDRFVDVEAMQRIVIGILRTEQAASPYSTMNDPIVDRLLTTNERFARSWGAHDVSWPHHHLSFKLRSGAYGEAVTVIQTVWQDVDDSRLRLLLLADEIASSPL